MPTLLESVSSVRSRSRRTGAALLGAVTLASVAGGLFAPASAAAVPTPPVPSGLPSTVEGLAKYVPATSCDPTAKPGATALGKLMTATYPGTTFGIDRACGAGALPTSEHYDGRAVDWMISVRKPEQKAQAEAALAWLFAKDANGNAYANARRLGVMYIVWNNRIWGAYRTGDGWRPYSSCASHPESSWDTTCHRNHVHFSLTWEGAMKRTSFWTKKVAAVDYGPCREADMNWASPYTTPRATPCPSYPVVRPPAGASQVLKDLTTYSGVYLHTGSSGPSVSAVQRALGVQATGSYGSETGAAVAAWRAKQHLDASTSMTTPAWRAMLKAFAPSAPTATPPAPVRTSPLTKYATTTLKYNSRGAAVVALQQTLHVKPASGWFGPLTKAAVESFQRSHHLSVTGVVDARTWKALGA